MATVCVFIKTSQSWPIPIDFDPTNFIVEVIGRSGAAGTSGGGGGGYAKKTFTNTNSGLVPGSTATVTIDNTESNFAGLCRATAGSTISGGTGTIGDLLRTGGNGGDVGGAADPSAGGGAAGPNGNGAKGGRSDNSGGPGGGGADGGSVGQNADGGAADGGNNRLGAGAGIYGTQTQATNGGGGFGNINISNPGHGSAEEIWTQTSNNEKAGPGSGGGANIAFNAGNGGSYGGGPGSARFGGSVGSRGPGIVVLTYQTRIVDEISVGIEG